MGNVPRKADGDGSLTRSSRGPSVLSPRRRPQDLYTHDLGLVPIRTPAYSPESNGLAEAFPGTFKRDNVGGVEPRDT